MRRGPTTTCNRWNACHVAGTCAATGVCSNPAAPAGARGDSGVFIEHCDSPARAFLACHQASTTPTPCTIDAW